MKENYAGIDYGMGRSNRDPDTGLRYGVIHQHEVGQAWYDGSEPYYVYVCPDCDAEFKNECPEKCSCGHEFDDGDFDFLEPISHYVDDDKYTAECGEDGDIFITKSPYFTYAQFCSPCAPGAIYLMTPFVNYWENSGTGQKGINSPENYPNDYKTKAENAGFAKGYCFGHDWFESGKAPYPVFSVETGELVLPKEE
jgi:hypothetical protein